MKIYNAVQTEGRAIMLLQEWLTGQLNDDNMNVDTTIKPCDLRCSCGQTPGMMAFYEAGNIAAFVAVCDACGDDDRDNPISIN